MLNFNQFKAQMLRHRPDNFTRKGLRTLYELLAGNYSYMLESDRVDYAAICCTWEEVSVKKFRERYPHERMTSREWSQFMLDLNGAQVSKFKFIVRNI